MRQLEFVGTGGSFSPLLLVLPHRARPQRVDLTTRTATQGGTRTRVDPDSPETLNEIESGGHDKIGLSKREVRIGIPTEANRKVPSGAAASPAQKDLE